MTNPQWFEEAETARRASEAAGRVVSGPEPATPAQPAYDAPAEAIWQHEEAVGDIPNVGVAP